MIPLRCSRGPGRPNAGWEISLYVRQQDAVSRRHSSADTPAIRAPPFTPGKRCLARPVPPCPYMLHTSTSSPPPVPVLGTPSCFRFQRRFTTVDMADGQVVGPWARSGSPHCPDVCTLKPAREQPLSAVGHQLPRALE